MESKSGCLGPVFMNLDASEISIGEDSRANDTRCEVYVVEDWRSRFGLVVRTSHFWSS